MAAVHATATSPLTAASSLKEFRCTFGSCTKSFSRAEHLHRHALNHDETKGVNTCERCHAVFKRKDLLDRHTSRHREKDAEAGGEGMGKLQTRKRLWRDSSGTVVAKRRPELEKPKSSTKSRRTSRKDTTATDTSIYSNHEIAPLSPPGSNDPDPMDASRAGHGQLEDLWPLGDAAFPSGDALPESYDFLLNASWGSKPPTQETTGTDLLYNDLFAPDTGNSFNNPFTTANYYNWLFGNENWPDVDIDPAAIDPRFSIMGNANAAPQPPSSIDSRGFSVSNSSGTSGDYSSTGQQYEQPQFGYGMPATASDYSAQAHDEPNAETSAANQILAMSKMAEYTLASNLGYNSVIAESPKNHQQHVSASPGFFPTPATSGSIGEPYHDLGQSKSVRKPPLVDEVARRGVLGLIQRAGPKTPDGSEITGDHPLLALPVLQEYCDLYFKRFNVSYPLLHQATFEPANVDPLLLMSVILLGATYDTKDSHLVAVCIHDTIRAQIFGSAAFNTRPTLWMLQTILLVECFGKSRAGQLQHDMSHLFHGLLINLIRRSDCQSARCQISSDDHDPHHRWLAEVDAEQRRRLALLCFMWDTQHAVLFSQSLCMSAAELKLTLPWNEALWEAETAEEWLSINSSEPPQPQYLSILKKYINPRSDVNMRPLNSLSRVLMLHGIMSVSWDLNRRDQTSLGLSMNRKEEPWQSRIARSYDAWKSDFDNYSKQTLQALEDDESKRNEFQRFCVANVAIYHAAHIILNVEINDLQIYAGASHIIGRPVMKADQDRSDQRIEQWAKHRSMAAAKSSSHAARILRDGIRKLKDWDAGDYFHYPWCLYLATLTCWAFQMCSKSDESGEAREFSEDEEDSDWDARAEMNALISAMTRSNLEDLWKVAGKYRTGDLPRVMAKHLARIRWAVVQEGMIVLKGLEGKTR
ncbi:fungal-specific transcription factor domain-containing protein [Rhexocercosporidium sp. MPI-PUGE-AT-0058]|nr:fungal-specific transcription factor domain-containing protein [Rhexocercosporidium sp. MPI-PUGE-AT-0058]